MPRYVVLLRGVTPTGRNRVLMAPLREALAEAGLREVETYIQSGNVLATSRLGRARLEALVHDVVERTQGADLAVMARTGPDLARVLARDPFAEADGARAHVTVLAAKPVPAAAAAFRAVAFGVDDLRLDGDVVYSHYASGMGVSKFHNNWMERALGVRATTRNLNTVRKLVELASGAGERARGR